MALFLRYLTWLVWMGMLLVGMHPAPGRALTGRVCTKAGQPLPGVVVRLRQTTNLTTTNAAGDFLLECEVDLPVLELTYVGYQDLVVRAVAPGPLRITLYQTGDAILPQASGLEAVEERPEAVDEPPAFPGGPAAYQAYLRDNLHYPEAALAKSIEGSVLVGFLVDEQGRVLNAAVVKGYETLNAEALRLVNHMPWWTPAKRQGKPVRAPFYLRIRFALQ